MTHWWVRPQLRGNDEDERKVGFLDLFYDLIFVVAVAQLGHDLAHHPEHIGQVALLFAAVWWLWIGNTFYTDRFETADVSHRVFTFLQMMPVVGLAVFAHGAFEETALQFAISYTVGRLLIIFLWWRGGRHNPEARPFTDRLVATFTLGITPWVISFFTPHEWLIPLWTLGLAIDLVAPIITTKQQAKLPAFHHSRLAERFGLFTIIVLGESVAGTVNGLGALDFVSGLGQLTGLLAMVLAFQLWWIYFDMVPRERIKQSHAAFVGRSYLHYPLLGAIAASGAGVLSIVGHEGDVLEAGQRWLLAGSVAAGLLAMIGLSRVHEYMPIFQGARGRTEGSLALAALACVAVGLFGTALGAVQILLAVVLITMVPIVSGAWYWARIADEDLEAVM